MKIHFYAPPKTVKYFREDGKTLCGKKLKGRGLNSPEIEATKEEFFNWSGGVRCKICEKAILKTEPCKTIQSPPKNNEHE